MTSPVPGAFHRRGKGARGKGNGNSEGGTFMSMTARHESRKYRQMCQRCRDRKARFQYRGEVRADRDHSLCFECYRSERNRQRAWKLPSIQGPMLRSPFDARPLLSDHKMAHRRRMLDYLSTAASRV
jgi:hypothetical protein